MTSRRTRSGRPSGLAIRNREQLRVDLARLGERATIARRLRQAVEHDRQLLARKYPYLPQAATIWDWLDKGKPVGWPGHALRDLAKFIRDQTGKPCDADTWIQPPASSFQVCGAPRRPSRSFRGRDVELGELKAWLASGADTSVSTAIEGLPGIGKTELALNVAHAFAAEANGSGLPTFPSGVFWFNAEGRDLTASWDEIARRWLAIDGATVRERVSEAIRRLERSPEPCLIILDNAFLGPDERWEPGRGKAFPLPESPRVRLLVTTRNAHFAPAVFRQKQLGVLSEPVSRQLLLDISGRGATRDLGQLDGLEELLVELGGHALALEVSGVHLQKNGSETPRTLLVRLLQGEQFARHARQTGYAVAKSDYEATLQGAFSALWSSLDAETRRHWQLAAQFEPAPVSVELSYAVGLSVDALAALKEFHLIEWDTAGKHWVMHRLTRAFGRESGDVEARSAAQRAFVIGCTMHASTASPELSLVIYSGDRPHFDAALALAPAAVDAKTELELALSIGPALITQIGYGDEQAQRLYSRAVEAAERAGGHEQVFLALHGLWVNCCLSGDWKAGAVVVRKLGELAHTHAVGTYWLSFYLASGQICFYMGRPTEALGWFERGAPFVAATPRVMSRTALDSQVMLLCHSAMAQCLAGLPDQALQHFERASQAALELGDPGTLAVTMAMRAGLHYLRGEVDEMAQYAARVVELGTTLDLVLYRHFGLIHLLWCRVECEPEVAEATLAAMRESLNELVRLNFGANRVFMTQLVADVCHRLGRYDEGRSLCDTAITVMARTGEGLFEVELWRTRATLEASPADAVACLRRAVEIATRQKAPWWQLRALTDLVFATKASERAGREAKDRLRELCATFTEGFALPDLRRAREALALPE